MWNPTVVSTKEICQIAVHPKMENLTTEPFIDAWIEFQNIFANLDESATERKLRARQMEQYHWQSLSQGRNASNIKKMI
jgi:hypothetical protein